MIEHDARVSLSRRGSLSGDLFAQYERMMEIRLFENRVNELFAQGIVHGTTHTCQGQEAVAVGIAATTRPTDHVVSTYRGHGIALALGVEPSVVLGEIMGRVTGSAKGLGGSMHLCSPEVGLLPTMAIVGAGIPIAAGAALGSMLLETGAVAVAIFGDGASNIGAFHEGLNLAAVWKLPVVFVCENNLYGEYTRIDRSTPIPDIASRAAAYDMPGSVVDGQDVIAVSTAMASAVEDARSGKGPSLIEMKTYRFVGHSRADTAPYRPDGELEEWLGADPLKILAGRLIEKDPESASTLHDIEVSLEGAIESVVQSTIDASEPDEGAMLTNVFPAG